MVAMQVRSQFQYRVSFWFDFASTTLLSGIMFLSLALVIQRFGSIAGWTLGEVAFLTGLVDISFGLMDLLFSGFDPDFFATNVQMGLLDQVLLRPMSVTWQVLGSRFLIRRFGRLLEGSAVFAFALMVTPVDWTAAKLLYLPVVIASQVLVMGALFIVGSTVTFWTVQRIEAMNTLTYGGAEMMTYPMNIFQEPLRRFFTYIVPFIFLNYYPALYILGRPDPFHLPAFAPFLAPLVAVGMLLLALALWRYGLSHYQSTGT
jgi:ABC-2 type transport system permease protein